MKKSSISERIRLIRKEMNLTQEALASVLGVGKSALSMIETGKASLSERNKNIFVQEFNVNPDWIDTGRGSMFNSPPGGFPAASSPRTADTVPLQSVPLYNLERSGSLLALFSGEEAPVPADYIHIPNLPKCDGAVYVAGDGMYPLLKSGDIVLYKQLNSIDNVFWGDMYLLSVDLDGEEYVTVKYIQKSDRQGYVRLVSYNSHHADKEIEAVRINALALVKASININSAR